MTESENASIDTQPTSPATGSRWGGCATYWTDSVSALPASAQPKFRIVEFDLKKLMSFACEPDPLWVERRAERQEEVRVARNARRRAVRKLNAPRSVAA